MKNSLLNWAAAVALLAQGAVVATGSAMAQQGEFADYPDQSLNFLAQSRPGSGFDVTTRAIAETLAKENLIDVPMPVTNMPSGAVGFTTAVTRHANDPYMVSVQSISAAMNYATGAIEYNHDDVTPIALLISDCYTVVVRADSPLQTLDDFLEALRADPKAFPISGGTSDDRVFYAVLFDKAGGIDATQINYLGFGGGGEAAALVLEGSAGAMFSSISEMAGMIRSGQMRALAMSCGERYPGDLEQVPTLTEEGVDVTWENYRYFMGGPDMPEEVVKFWQDKMGEMVQSATWQEMKDRYLWSDLFMTEGVDAYLDERQEVILDVLRRLGVAAR